MDTVLESLFLRRPKLHYVSPPVCDNLFSSSSGPVIVLNVIERQVSPTGLVLGGEGGVNLSWSAYPGALCYSVYKSDDPNDPFGAYTIIAECIPSPFFDLGPFGPGYYRVSAITTDGETPLSPPVHLEGAAPVCPPESGPPSPTGPTAFDITGEVLWDPFTFFPTTEWPGFEGSGFLILKLPTDYPPGHYDVSYVSGFNHADDSGCDPGKQSYIAAMYALGDAEHNLDTFMWVANGIFQIDAPFGGPFGSGLGDCFLTTAAGESFFSSFFAGPPRLRWKHDNLHTNTGGQIHLVWDSNGVGPVNFILGHELKLQLIQVDGLVQQPRKLFTLSSVFPPDVAGNWDGILPTRTTYAATLCQYNADPAGAFGGAVVYYTQTHPTAANGCGWVIEIYIGVILVWKGYKTVGDGPAGIYYRSSDSPITPACITVEEFV